MHNQFNKTDRVAGQMQRKLAHIIQQEIEDPRLTGFVTISDVRVARDLGHAKVYFTVFNGDPQETELVLNEASTYLRTALARTMTARTVPQLHFIHDASVEYGSRLSRLIDAVNVDITDTDNEPKDE
jgi:ribosome-binding factor A